MSSDDGRPLSDRIDGLSARDQLSLAVGLLDEAAQVGDDVQRVELSDMASKVAMRAARELQQVVTLARMRGGAGRVVRRG